MDLGDVTTLLRESVYQVIIMVAPILFSAMIVGLVIAIFQATTSIQEQTLTFVPKLFTILILLGFLGGLMFSSMGEFTVRLFNLIPGMAR
jgi:flagellar biosynthetic protein FliQ